MEEGGWSHLGLYIAVGDIQGGETFQKLAGDILGVPDGTGTRAFEVQSQVAVLNIFHCTEEEVDVRVPAVEFDKEAHHARYLSLSTSTLTGLKF